MIKTPSILSVAIENRTALIKVTGRANFSASVDFKALVLEQQALGMDRLLIELSECATMDSTFLGVLTAVALKAGREGPGAVAGLELLNANPRIADLLENLGVSHLFAMSETREGHCFEPAQGAVVASRDVVSRTCLEAHETLIAVNPENLAKFKEVTQFLAEDLKRSAEKSSAG